MTALAAELRRRQLGGMGRPERVVDASRALALLSGQRVLVAGAAGQLGSEFTDRLRGAGAFVVATDLDPAQDLAPWGCVRMDITRFDDVLRVVNFHEPDLIVNLAAAKLAPAGELDPWRTIDCSVNGLKNLLDMGRSVVHVSTCKAADPEVAYGAGKLAAEKLAMAYGQRVLRLYNVPEAGPSMLTIWRDLHDRGEALPVAASCVRYTVTKREAVAAVVAACALPRGRYAIDPGGPVTMGAYALGAFPDDARMTVVPPRRGDRLVEPRHAQCERLEPSDAGGIDRVVSSHDEGEDRT